MSVFNSRKRRYKRINLGRPPPPFSVSINDAVIGNTSAVLSVIRITTANCNSVTQHLVKHILFTKRDQYLKRAHMHPRIKYKRLQLFLLPLLYLFSATPSVHAVPGTNHVLFKGHTSLDKTRQHKYVDTIINKLEKDNNIITKSASNTISEAAALPSPLSTRGLQQEPYCFVVDTDSIPYIIDTGANRIIVNDARHLQDLVATSDKIKGIGGKCVRIAGVGKLSLPLTSDDGSIDVISGLNAVYVPSSPYNLIPPQILIKQMKIKGFAIDRFNHDDTNYTFVYSSPSLPINTPPRSITIPLGSNQLFTLRTSEGYSNFMSRAPKYLDSFKHFAGASHFIP